MTVRLKIHHKGLIIVSVPLVLGTAFLLFLYGLLIQSEDEAREESHANDVLHSIFVLGKELFSGLNALTAYSYMKTPSMEQKYLDSRARIVNEFKVLRLTLGSYPDQVKQLEKTERLEMRALKICDGMYDAFHDENTDLMTVMNIRGMRNQLESLVENTIAELKSLNELVQTQSGSKSEAALSWRRNAKVVLLCGAAFNILLSVVVVLYFSRAITDRLKILIRNAYLLAIAQPLLPAIKGVDEIAELDKVFHQMADTIAESKKRQKALVDNAVDVICSIDKNYSFITVSPASEKVWGYTETDLSGKGLRDIVIEEDLEETLKCLSALKMVESTVPVENRVRCKNGKVINVLWSVYWSQQEEELYCVAHDITARKMVENLLKDSEERTRSMMEGLPVGLFVIDVGGTIHLANNKAQELFAMSNTDLAGRSLSAIFKNSEGGRGDWMDQLIMTRSHVLELVAVRPDGSEFPVELSANEVSVLGRPLHLVAMLDVSERHEIERLKREFVAMVSHDLKTPLSSVRGLLLLLSEGATGELPPKAKPVVKTAEGQLERLIKLINDLLDVQKMEAGKFQIEKCLVSIRSILEQSFDAVEQFAKDHEIKIEIRGEDMTVDADPDRISQVVVNLLSNAVKFSPKGATVKLSIVCETEFVEVKVEDEGRGIKDEFRETVFQRFKQIEHSDATTKRGSGLGLAICKLIVEEHGGTIGVDSTPGKGSTFWFRLPCK